MESVSQQRNAATELRHRGPIGSWHNPISLSRVNPDRVLDTTTVLRADDLHLPGGSQRNQRTAKLPSLAGDRHLTFVVASVRVATMLIAADGLASPQYSRRRWARFADGAAIQRIDLEAMGEGADLPARQTVIPGQADYETAEYAEDCLPAYLERDIDQPQYTAATVEIERSIGRARITLIVSGEARIQHLADCILQAMRELQLVR